MANVDQKHPKGSKRHQDVQESKGSKGSKGGKRRSKGSKASKASKASSRSKAYKLKGGKALPEKLLAFQKIVKEAAKKLGKGGRNAMKIAAVANNAAKAKLGDTAATDAVVKEAINLLNSNFDKYKSQAGV